MVWCGQKVCTGLSYHFHNSCVLKGWKAWIFTISVALFDKCFFYLQNNTNLPWFYVYWALWIYLVYSMFMACERRGHLHHVIHHVDICQMACSISAQHVKKWDKFESYMCLILWRDSYYRVGKWQLMWVFCENNKYIMWYGARTWRAVAGRHSYHDRHGEKVLSKGHSHSLHLVLLV